MQRGVLGLDLACQTGEPIKQLRLFFPVNRRNQRGELGQLALGLRQFTRGFERSRKSHQCCLPIGLNFQQSLNQATQSARRGVADKEQGTRITIWIN